MIGLTGVGESLGVKKLSGLLLEDSMQVDGKVIRLFLLSYIQCLRYFKPNLTRPWYQDEINAAREYYAHQLHNTKFSKQRIAHHFCGLSPKYIATANPTIAKIGLMTVAIFAHLLNPLFCCISLGQFFSFRGEHGSTETMSRCSRSA